MSVVSLPDLHKAQRLLIIRLSSIGDVVHALPISAALGEAFPHLEITWLVEEMSADIVTGNPYLHETLVIPRSRWKKGRLRSPQVWREYLAFLRGLRSRRFDVTLDLQGYGKSALYALATGAKHRLGWWRMRDGAGLVSRSLPKRESSVHRVDWFLDVARALGAEPATVRFPLHIPEASRQKVSELLRAGGLEDGEPYVALNPAVGDLTRRWGASRYAELAVGLAQRFGLRSVLIGSGKDAVICEEVRSLAEERLRQTEKVVPMPAYGEQGIRKAYRFDRPDRPLPLPISLAGKTQLKELAAVLERCAAHVCGDTGSAHIAGAAGCPVISLYGPTDPAHAGVWGQSANVLSHRELCAAGCSVRQCARPVEGTARCLAEITTEEVLQRVGQVLK